ncbi:MAG: ABC transporter permease [Spirochaetia bacterium]|nr:ABC transporter permease [Spirochaetia bacterium]
MSQAQYILKRILWMIPTFIGIVTITFILVKMRPDPISMKAFGADGMKETSVSEKYMEDMRKYFGDDKPIHIQYFKIWENILTLNFGESRINHRPVIEKIKEALPVTLTLNIITIFIVYLISVPLAVFSALKDTSTWDNIVTFFLYFLYSLPSFWTALILLKYFSSGTYFNWFPLSGLTSIGHEEFTFFQKIQDLTWHLILPIIVSVYASFAFLSRFIKSSFMEALRSDYIRTAKAKGLSKRRIVYIHVMRNSLIPLITLMAGILPELFAGSVIIESIFSIPGMGKLAFDSIHNNDHAVIIAVVSISSFLTLLGILLSDIGYTLVDPRISFEQTDGT